MGYDIHITRAENWVENQGYEITTQEWLNLVQEDQELVLMPENGKYFVIWHGTIIYPETWFDWSNGNIDTKAPDKATLQKMLQIAKKLNAKVQGDEGEIYNERTIDGFDDSFLNPNPPSNKLKVNSKETFLSTLLCKIRRLK